MSKIWNRNLEFFENVELDIPYSKYSDGEIHIDPLSGRKYILAYLDGKIRFKTTYARYIFQIDYWKQHKKWIPYGYEVDHINNCCFDDRLENLQLLTRVQNIRKRDFTNYCSLPVSIELLDDIELYLNSGYSRGVISDKCGITMGYLRYLIQKHFPKYITVDRENNDIVNIEDMLKRGMSARDIGDIYGVSRQTIRRIVEKYLPNYMLKESTKNIVETIKSMLLEGRSLQEIAKELEFPDTSNLYHYINTYLKDFYDKIRNEKDDERDKLIENVGKLIKSRYDYPYHLIAKELGTTQIVVGNIVREHYPEWTEPEQYKRLVDQVGQLKNSGLTTKEISDKLGVRTDVITNVFRKFYPEQTWLANAEKKRKLVKMYLDQSLSKKEIAEKLDMDSANLSGYIKRYFPEYNEELLQEKKYTEIIQFMKNNPQMSRRQVALLFKVNRDNLKKVIEERNETVPQLKNAA